MPRIHFDTHIHFDPGSQFPSFSSVPFISQSPKQNVAALTALLHVLPHAVAIRRVGGRCQQQRWGSPAAAAASPPKSPSSNLSGTCSDGIFPTRHYLLIRQLVICISPLCSHLRGPGSSFLLGAGVAVMHVAWMNPTMPLMCAGWTLIAAAAGAALLLLGRTTSGGRACGGLGGPLQKVKKTGHLD